MVCQALEDELTAIDSIYPEAIEKSSGSDSTYVVKVPDTNVEFYLTFDHEYPATSPRVSSASAIDKSVLESLLRDNIGEEVLFPLISAIQEQVADASAANELHDKTEAEESTLNPETDYEAVQWTIGEAVHDRKSVMLGRACRVTTQDELDIALASIDHDKRLQKATHPRIWACRYRNSHGNIVSENDDDGETAAGSRLAFLLNVTDAQDVLVVVTRWFGGVLLGDIRFKHISTAARDALQRGGFLSSEQDLNHKSSNKNK